MTLEEARETFLNRGWIKAEGGTYFDGDKWREAVMVISDYLQKEQCEDCISRQAAIDALNGIINRFEQILRDIRESKVDDSVCGMCEYDGAFVGQSGDWCNECPGFEKDDCFRLSDECRKRWLESLELPAAHIEEESTK